MQGAGADDPSTVLNFISPDVSMAMEHDIVLSRNDHGLKHIVAMAVGEAQQPSSDLEVSPDAMAGVAISAHRRPQRVLVPVAIAEDPMDIKIRESLDSLRGRDVTAVDQGLDPLRGENLRRLGQPFEPPMTVRKNADQHASPRKFWRQAARDQESGNRGLRTAPLCG